MSAPVALAPELTTEATSIPTLDAIKALYVKHGLFQEGYTFQQFEFTWDLVGLIAAERQEVIDTCFRNMEKARKESR